MRWQGRSKELSSLPGCKIKWKEAAVKHWGGKVVSFLHRFVELLSCTPLLQPYPARLLPKIEHDLNFLQAPQPFSITDSRAAVILTSCLPHFLWVSLVAHIRVFPIMKAFCWQNSYIFKWHFRANVVSSSKLPGKTSKKEPNLREGDSSRWVKCVLCVPALEWGEI